MSIRHSVWRLGVAALLCTLLGGVLVFTAPLRAQGTPSLTLIAPTEGASVDGPVTVRVEHGGIVFDGTKIGTDPEPGVGHWHVNIDGKYAGLAVSNVLEIPNDAFPTISAGQHTIMVNLHENNHAVTNPPVEHSITLNFSRDVTLAPAIGGVPSLTLVDPGEGADGGMPIVVRVEHGGIVFDGTKIGTDPEPGVGHWHVNIDGKYAGLAVSNVLEIPNDAFPTISAGQHTIMVNLHENNHAVTNPPVEQAFQINLSKDLSMGAGAPTGSGATTTGAAAGAASTATAGAMAHGAATTATAAGLSNLPNTGIGGAGQTSIAWTVAILAVLLLGGLFRYGSRARRTSHGRRR